MVYQVYAGYDVGGWRIKVPQVFIPRVMRAYFMAETAGGNKMLNVLHLLNPVTPIVGADCLAVATFLEAWAAAEYSHLFTSQITITSVHVRSMEGPLVPEVTLPTNIQGGIHGDPLPPSTTCPVELTTGFTGQQNKGAFYPFPPTEAENTADGTPDPTYHANLETAMGLLIAAALAGSAPIIVASFTWQVYAEVATAVASHVWGEQRRRGLKYQ